MTISEISRHPNNPWFIHFIHYNTSKAVSIKPYYKFYKGQSLFLLIIGSYHLRTSRVRVSKLLYALKWEFQRCLLTSATGKKQLCIASTLPISTRMCVKKKRAAQLTFRNNGRRIIYASWWRVRYNGQCSRDKSCRDKLGRHCIFSDL